MKKERRRHTEAFKREAVQLMENRGTRSVEETEDDLGVAASQLYDCRRNSRVKVARNEKGETLAEENRRLRRENRVLKMEREILKKAAAFFAKENP
jgi:transposase